MKLKMHLAAHAPNEGARQLAQWVARECGGDLDRAAQRLWITGMGVQRVIDGEITPGTALGTRLRKACGLSARMFNRPALASWFFEPAAQQHAA